MAWKGKHEKGREALCRFSEQQIRRALAQFCWSLPRKDVMKENHVWVIVQVDLPVTWWRRSVHHVLMGQTLFEPITSSQKAGKELSATEPPLYWGMCLDFHCLSHSNDVKRHGHCVCSMALIGTIASLSPIESIWGNEIWSSKLPTCSKQSLHCED